MLVPSNWKEIQYATPTDVVPLAWFHGFRALHAAVQALSVVVAALSTHVEKLHFLSTVFGVYLV